MHVKGQVPALPVSYLSRPRLLKLLQQPAIHWLNAAAGFGKSLLLSDLAKKQHFATIWFSLSSNDTQDSEFLYRLLRLCAAQQDELAQAALDHWYRTEAQGHVDVEQVLLIWLASLRHYNKPLAITFDNVHELGQSSAWALLVRLLELLPENIHCHLAGRFLPAATGRLRLMPNLQWYDESTLALSDEEFYELLQAQRIELATQIKNSLNRQLQGWPAGIAIWLLHYRATGDTSVNAADAELGDYLKGEVLSHISAELQHFMQLIGVLTHFDEGLLAYLYGNKQYHSHLQQAQERNLFIHSEKQLNGWFRVHPVMADLLALQMPVKQRMMIHQQAFQYLSQSSTHAVQALHHALHAQLAEEVQHWVLQQSESILANLDFATLLEWFEQIGANQLAKSPRLMVIYTWTLLLTQQREPAQRYIRQMQVRGVLQPGEEDALLAYCKRMDGDFIGASEHALAALKILPSKRFSLRILMNSVLTHLNLAQYNLEVAQNWSRQAQELAQESQEPAMIALCLYDQARVAFHQGRLRQSLEHIERAVQLTSAGSGSARNMAKGRLLIYRALLWWLGGRPASVIDDSLQQGIHACIEMRDVYVCYGYALLSVRLAISKKPNAIDELDKAEWLMQRWQAHPFVYQWLNLVRVQLLLAEGQINQAQQCLDELEKAMPQGKFKPELMPLQDRFMLISQARIYLFSGQYGNCLQLIEMAFKQKNSPVVQLLLSLLKVSALRAQGQPESQILLQQILQMIEREKISADILTWLPGLTTPMPRLIESKETLINSNLSDRELDVLKKIAQGLSNQEIAEQLFISLHTVKTHARKINVKLASKNRTQALHRARELGLI